MRLSVKKVPEDRLLVYWEIWKKSNLPSDAQESTLVSWKKVAFNNTVHDNFQSWARQQYAGELMKLLKDSEAEITIYTEMNE